MRHSLVQFNLPTSRIVQYNSHHQVGGVTCSSLHTNIITGEPVEGEMSTSEVFQHSYPQLVEMLPSNNVTDKIFLSQPSS